MQHPQHFLMRSKLLWNINGCAWFNEWYSIRCFSYEKSSVYGKVQLSESCQFLVLSMFLKQPSGRLLEESNLVFTTTAAVKWYSDYVEVN